MPNRPKKPCNKAGCSELIEAGQTYCDKHRQEKASRYERYERDQKSKRLYNYRWAKASRAYLNNNPLCVECKKNNKITPARVTDHIVPHKGNKKIFWDRSNWQPLCDSCHSRKTAKEDGGFGNKVVANPNK